MSERYIDLHTHSNVSDGTDSPAELVKKAVDLGLGAIALTDHDTIDGIAEAKETIRKLGVEDSFRFIPGIEISAGYKRKDIHILGLGVDENNRQLIEALNEARRNREERNVKMADNIAKDGVNISAKVLYEQNEGATITRAHFAKYLVENGYCKDMKAAFDKYLDADGPYYVPREYISPEDAIRLIHAAGGKAILAHPLLYHLPEQELLTLMERLCRAGLDGVEAIYSSNISNEEDYVRGLAKQYHLKISGGTDYHGANKAFLELGVGRGNMRIPMHILEDMGLQ
ncbi:MAG: PHP domain-containing protein [Lachnospiraceae bacterium]|nr:PHP domain-containing protein [Lachnospiraceae bacterium]